MKKATSVLLLCAWAVVCAGQSRDSFIEQRSYPSGIPDNALNKALKQRAVLENQVRALAYGSSGDDTPAPTPIWTLLGPNGISTPEGWQSGRVTALATDSRNPEHIYLAASGGGVWRSTDGGTNWRSLGDNLLSLSSGALALDARNGALYYGTGDSTSDTYGAGVLRSGDGGASWQQLGAQFVRGVINRIVPSPQDARTLYAARGSSFLRSSSAGETWDPLLSGYVSDFALDPNDARLIFVALGHRDGRAANGLYRSTDAGASWNLVSGLPAGVSIGRISLAKSVSNPGVIFAVLSRSADYSLEGVYRSDDFGASWRKSTFAPPNLFLNGRFHQGNQTNLIAIDPRTPDRVYLGGTELYRSTDGGVTWTAISTRNGQRSIHESIFFLAFKPNQPDTIYVGTDGGVYRSNDGGDTWTNLNRGLPIAQFIQASSLTTSPGAAIVFGGVRSSGAIRLSGDSSGWEQLLRGDVGAVAIDPGNSNTLFAALPLVQIMRSTDAGGSWVQTTQGISAGDPVGYFPPLQTDPSLFFGRNLYFGTNRIWRSGDGGEAWSAVSLSLTSGFISSLAPGSQIAYAGTSDGRVYSNVGGQAWQSGAGVPHSYISSIVVDRNNPQRAFLTTASFQTGHVFRTLDGGRNWQDVSGNLPDAPSSALVIDPRGPVYVATDVGVFRSEDGSNSWTSFNLGLPNAFVTALALDTASNTLFAGTYGRGAWQISLRAPGSALGPSLLARGVVNAASYSVELAPGGLASIFGSRLANDTILYTSLPWVTQLGGATVTVNGVPAPLFFVSPTQINFQMPFEVPDSGAIVVVTTVEGSASAFVQVAPASPGIFSVAHADNRPVNAANPASAGEVLIVYSTGLGLTNQRVVSGQASPSSPPAQINLPVEVTVGGAAAAVQFAGLSPGLVGLYQVNIVVPGGTTGDATLVLKAGGRLSNTVTIPVR